MPHITRVHSSFDLWCDEWIRPWIYPDSFDGGVLVQDLKEKAVKSIYLIVRIVEKISYMEGNICQIVNKAIAVVVFICSRGYK